LPEHDSGVDPCSIPSVIVLTALLLSLCGGSIRVNTPTLFALGFLPA